MKKWHPQKELSKAEEKILSYLKRTKKLFAFLRLYRHEIINEAFEVELEQMYRQTGAGEEPISPGILCMALLMQAYTQSSDAEAVQLTCVDARWQLVLDCLGADKPAFSQGTLQRFRQRFIDHQMDQRLLERTIDIARRSKAFDWRKLPKTLEVAYDSRPLTGAGRVEDTINLLGHAARKLIMCTATLTQTSAETIAQKAGTTLFLQSSVKAALDVDWNVPEQKEEGLNRVMTELNRLQTWLTDTFYVACQEEGALFEPFQIAQRVKTQDVEKREDGSFKKRKGVAKDRLISIEDPQMRHGRKSKSKTFNGYKEHIARDLNSDLILSCALTPGNCSDAEAAVTLNTDIKQQKQDMGELYVDLGYHHSPVIDQLEKIGVEIISKPRPTPNAQGSDLFTKSDFTIDLKNKTITCPAGQSKTIKCGKKVQFAKIQCDPCKLRQHCTTRKTQGRIVSISQDEPRQQNLQKQMKTSHGRKKLRRRTSVEHGLARISQKKGHRARYRGTRKNLFDLRRTASIINLETIMRKEQEFAKAAA